MAELSFLRRNGEAIVAGLVTASIVGGVSFLYVKDAAYLSLFTYCLGCGVLTLVGCAAVIVLRRIPKPLSTPNDENIEDYVRGWLDSYGITVKRDPSDATYFRYRIVLPAPDSEHLTIFRMRTEFPQYINVYADLSVTTEQAEQLVNLFSEEELNKVLYEIKLELARSRIGYSGLVIPPTDFKVFRKMLIHTSLRETDFFSAIYEVEAAIHLVTAIFTWAMQQKHQKTEPLLKK